MNKLPKGQKQLEEKNNNEVEKVKEVKEVKEVETAINNLIGQHSAIVFKNYLPSISKEYHIKKIDNQNVPEETVAFFDITKLVTEEKDKMVEKLKNVYHLLAYSDNSLALIIHRKHDSCKIAIAVGKCQDSEAAAKLAESVRDAVVGNFPGTSCSGINPYMDTDDGIFQTLNSSYFNKNNILNYNSVAVVSNIASQFSEDYINQGIEKVIDGIVPAENKEYTMVILGEALNSKVLEEKKRELYRIYTILSPYSKRTENWSLSSSQSWGKNKNVGLTYFVNIGAGYSENNSYSKSSGSSVDINFYGVTHTLEIIEKQMERLEKCEALGIWNIATYVFSPDFQLVSEVAHMYMSLTQGNESFYEKPSINVWNSQRNDNNIREEVEALAEYVRRLEHPKFQINTNKADNASYWPEEVTPTAVISGAELAFAMNLPMKSVPGFSLIECASFGREIVSYDKNYAGEVHIGKIHHMHHNEEKSVDLNKESFSSHVFITGSTGAGKSNAVYTLLDSLKTTFMVIEPAKGEYKYAFTNNVQVYGSNPQVSELLRINPFAFNRSIHVYEHIDRLLDVFNVCWPMYAAMPAVLKDAIIKAYENCGWNLITSLNDKGDIYPTFVDVCDEIDNIINGSDYSDENKGNYRGSLKTRLNSLTNGINQLIFCNGNISDRDLFEQNTIIDLSRIGSSENKSLIMGLLVIRLQEYRMSEGSFNSELKHVTVLEEAHNLLRRTSASSSDENSNVTGKAVEMIANAIAEMRTYGEGFIIVDQSPSLLDMSAIRNTNTKIILRLPDKDDRELVGRAANLNDGQIRELARLQRGVAAVYQNEWIEPILCMIDKHDSSVGAKANETINYLQEEDTEARRYINSCVYDPEYITRKSDLDFIDCINRINCDGAVKALLIDFNRLPFDQAQMTWQKLAFKYFNIRECVKNTKGITSFEEWNNAILLQLEKYEFDKAITLNKDSEQFYRFTQLMTFEAIIWLQASHIDQPEKGLQLRDYMDEFKNSFLKKY
ncbi:MAG: ATP-binding protein [Lachnospiraceae bacterium]|nr:ATP-binding protein [Lachnospiraceae bacterium]